MSLFPKKSSENVEPTLDAKTDLEEAAKASSAASGDVVALPSGLAPRSRSDEQKPDKIMSSDNKPSEGAAMASSRPPSAGFVPEIPRRTIDLPGAPGRRPAPAQRSGSNEGKKLIVGREISLSGEITACETLIVEGTVEATLENGQSLEISESGLFRGTVVIDEAVIAGTFEGALTARERLTVKSTGHIKGSVTFRQIEIELGGEIDGEIHVMRPETLAEPKIDS